MSQNEKLTYTLQQAKEQLALLREEVEKLTQPPAAYGTFLGINPDGSVDVFARAARCAWRCTRTSTPPSCCAATRSCSTSP